MRECPGLLPWHFGGDPWLTYAEAESIIDYWQARQEEYEEQAREQKKAAAAASMNRRR